jgi:hypothetical protein
METTNTYTAFEEHRLLFSGSLVDVITRIKRRLGKAENSAILIFSDATGAVMDFDFRGTEKDVLKRLDVFVSLRQSTEAPGPGRPKLGVISREVSLLPRHWEWLASQSGGASATLRRLVEDASRKALGGSGVRKAQERSHKFMSALAGDFEGYEEALRALYKKDEETFLAKIATWPRDVRNHVVGLAEAAFKGPTPTG